MKYLDINNIDDLFKVAQIGAKKEETKVYQNSEELEKYLNMKGLNLSINDVENIIKSQISEFSTLKNLTSQNTILEDLGVNIWDSSMSGADGIKAANLSKISFDFLNENETFSVSTNQIDSLNYANNRVYGVLEMHKTDLINKSGEQVKSWLLIETKKAIHEAIFKKLISKITALTAVTGYDSGDTAKVFALSDFNALEASNSGEYSNFNYVVTGATARTLKETDSGFSEALLKDRKINDINTYVRKELADSEVILGDFSKSATLIHGINIIADPYTLSNQHKILFQITAKCDVHILDSNSFSVAKNFSS